MPDAKRLHEAKQKKDGYRQDSAESESSPETPQEKRDLSQWTDIVGQRIEQAMREGAFDNLPGKGKPLDLKKNPFVPEERQMAYKLLENNGLAPSWISERTSVLTAIDALRVEINAGVRSHKTSLQGTTDPAAVDLLTTTWQVRLATWSDSIATLNKRIESVNLQQPIAHLEIIKLRLPDELTRAGAGAELAPPA